MGEGYLHSFLGFILLNSLTYMVALTLAHETSPCGHLSSIGIDLPFQSPSAPSPVSFIFNSGCNVVFVVLSHTLPLQMKSKPSGLSGKHGKGREENLSVLGSPRDPVLSHLEVISSQMLFPMWYPLLKQYALLLTWALLHYPCAKLSWEERELWNLEKAKGFQPHTLPKPTL